MVGVARDLRGSSSPTPLPKQGHLQQAPQDLIQVGFEYLQRTRIHNLSGKPVPGVHHLRVRMFFLIFSWNFLCFSLCPSPVVLSLGTTEDSGPILLTPTLKIFIRTYKVPSQPSLLQPKQAQLPQPFALGRTLQSPNHPRSPLLDTL